jgi:hypothetical protein
MIETIFNAIMELNFIYAFIGFVLALFLAAFILHISTGLLGYKRRYETAFGVSFLVWLILVLLGWILGKINLTLSATLSSIIALFVWILLVRKYYKTSFWRAIIIFLINIGVQIIIYLIVLLFAILFGTISYI